MPTSEMQVAAAAWLPHRPPMLVVDTILEPMRAGRGTVELRLRANTPYCIDGKVQSYWYVEMMAQAVGALVNQSASPQSMGNASFGYLIKIDDFQVESDWEPDLGMLLQIHVELELDFHPVGQFNTEIRCAGHCLARAQMKFLTAAPALA